MRALDKKLFRDIWRMRVHAAGVILVLACGLAMFVMAVGMRETLERTRAEYYARQRMADLSVSVVRAPNRLEAALAAAPGVQSVETRIAGYALLDLPQIEEPAAARIVSLPPGRRPRINDLVLARGRWPDPTRPQEVMVNEAFANALRLQLGDRIAATLHGRRQSLTVTGFANSPEFVFVTAPGEMFPQPGRFGVIWMGREGLARAYDLDGAFNDAVFRLSRGANAAETKRAIDALLRPFGSSGANGRDRMVSDRYLSEELRQLATMAAFLPAFFLIVAAFLVNIALGRVIATERSNIGLMKAFGYSNAAVAWHYAKSALIFALIGIALGAIAGVAFGRAIAALYRVYYHFPQLEFQASVATFMLAMTAGVGAAGLGAVASVLRSARLAPAAALAPPRPTTYSSTDGTLLGAMARGFDAKSRIILRRIVRFPRRAATTAFGISLAIALLVVSRTFPAVMEHILDVQFTAANRQDVTLSLIEPRTASVLHEIERLPGVIYAEPFGIESMRLSFRGRRVDEAVFGLAPGARLNRLIGSRDRALEPPAAGIFLARALAAKLGAHAGDVISVEQTRGRRVTAEVQVAGVVDPMVGSSGYMAIDDLARLVREPGRISGAYVRLDETQRSAFNRRIKEVPALAGASFLRLAERSMRESIDRSVGTMNLLYGLFAAVMAGGVAFSAARVTLAEQERDLATLRVLGFTRAEVSYVLVGELAVLALAAVPVGCLLGVGLGMWLMRLFETDMYAFPYVYNPGGFAYAVAFAIGCVLAAALVVRQSIDRLDMVGVLKARD
ncbi:ABC transporter permease [Terricaulis sp.]|uniref:ABC transporter permease n=1 Tax=Terricaulis sp. TaxID=2768686 RepID=UPI0037838D7B